MPRTRTLKSIEIVDWAQYGPIRSFINVLFVFNLIYICYFTRSTPNLTKPIKNGRLGPKWPNKAQMHHLSSFYRNLIKFIIVFHLIHSQVYKTYQIGLLLPIWTNKAQLHHFHQNLFIFELIYVF